MSRPDDWQLAGQAGRDTGFDEPVRWPDVETLLARTPEELEMLLEDALLVRDGAAVAGLFDDGAVLVLGDSQAERGTRLIALRALATWEGEHSYVAHPRCVMQARDIALVISEHGVNVSQRSRDGGWRFLIVHQFDTDDNGKAQGRS